MRFQKKDILNQKIKSDDLKYLNKYSAYKMQIFIIKKLFAFECNSKKKRNQNCIFEFISPINRYMI